MICRRGKISVGRSKLPIVHSFEKLIIMGQGVLWLVAPGSGACGCYENGRRQPVCLVQRDDWICLNSVSPSISSVAAGCRYDSVVGVTPRQRRRISRWHSPRRMLEAGAIRRSGVNAQMRTFAVVKRQIAADRRARRDGRRKSRCSGRRSGRAAASIRLWVF